MRNAVGVIAYVAALAAGISCHRALNRVTGATKWPGQLGWVGGQALVGAGAGLVAALGAYVMFGNLDDPLEGRARVLVALISSVGLGILLGGGYALTDDREQLQEELAAADRYRDFAAVDQGDRVRQVELFLRVQEDLDNEVATLGYRPGEPPPRPAPAKLAADRRALEGFLNIPELPETVRMRVLAAVARVKARQRSLGYGSPDAA